jgi:hypothetical protein
VDTEGVGRSLVLFYRRRSVNVWITLWTPRRSRAVCGSLPRSGRHFRSTVRVIWIDSMRSDRCIRIGVFGLVLSGRLAGGAGRRTGCPPARCLRGSGRRGAPPRSHPARLPARPPRGGGSPSSLRCLLLGVLLGARSFVLALLSLPNGVKLFSEVLLAMP